MVEPVTGHLKDLGPRTVQTRHRARRIQSAPATATAATPAATDPATRCDLDHLCAWCKAHPEQGGPTSAANLAAELPTAPPRQNMGILTVEGDANGTITWTDQHGHQATTQPHDYNNGL